MDSPVLREGEVHLWWARLSLRHEEHADVSRMLSADERRRSDRYRVEPARRHFVAGRGMLRVLIGSYLDVDPAAVRISYGPFGKPLLDPWHRSDLAFSVSHSDDVAVYAVGRSPAIGVDVEHVRPVADGAIVERYFAPEEVVTYRALPDSHKRLAFFLGWTRKEACLKACGAGLTDGLASVEVTFVPGGPPRIVGAPVPGDESPWWLQDIPAPAGLVGALTVRGKRPQLTTRMLPPAEIARRIHGRTILYA
jgi:4'-phosphopantetheinyl transferase